MIEVDGLSKTFRVHKKEPGLAGSLRALVRRRWIDKVALQPTQFSIGAGEVVGLIGENGAGKTTLVKMLSGIVHPTSGRATVLGCVPWERKLEFRQNIALIMGQKAQLWWDLPAADCFELLREIYRIERSEFTKRLDELTDALAVRDELKIQIRRLSLGERMKMELIAALLHRPRVVFLDEPTIGLDLVSQRAIREFILEYRRRYQPAMIVTSHYMDDIERLCPRILILREGQLVYDGSLDAVLRGAATFKVVSLYLPEGRTLPADWAENGHAELGVERNQMTYDPAGILHIRVPRDEAARRAAAWIERFSAVDVNIEDTPLEAIIENILKGGSVPGRR